MTYRPAELKLLAQRRLTAAVKDFYFLQDNYEFDPSPTLLDREVEKIDIYGHIVVVATKQHLDGKRSTLPLLFLIMERSLHRHWPSKVS